MELREWRRAAGVSQQELAETANVSRALVSQVETGRIKASIMFTGKIARALSSLLNFEVHTWDIFPGQFCQPEIMKAMKSVRPGQSDRLLAG